jgi:hypothetical protein
MGLAAGEQKLIFFCLLPDTVGLLHLNTRENLVETMRFKTPKFIALEALQRENFRLLGLGAAYCNIAVNNRRAVVERLLSSGVLI